MWLYQKKLMQIDKEFENARQTIKSLQEILALRQGIPLATDTRDRGKKSGGESEKIDPKISLRGIKLQLELAIGMIRLLKEQASYYIKVGENFDLAKFVDDLVNEFTIRDADTTIEVCNVIRKRWNCGLLID